MQRRIYAGPLSTADLATYLVQHYDPQDNLQAQDIGQGGAHAVQIGRGDEPEELRQAVTVAITERPDGQPGIAVTMGQQQWLTPGMATSTAAVALVGALVTPWALFGLLWPIKRMVAATTLPNDIWNTVDTYAASRGGTLVGSEDLKHPHVGD